MNYWTQSKDNIYVAAHRGFSSDYPENTMIAFKKAVELGVDQIETDIRLTKDGELVIFHDASVGRTTDGEGLVIDHTLAELKALDAGIKKGEQFKGERIPTFIEFMDFCKDVEGLSVDLEFKEYPENVGDKAYEAADKILQIVADYGFEDRVVINSFSSKVHEYIIEKYGKKYKHHVFYPVTCMTPHTTDPYSYAYCCCMFAEESGNIMASKEAFDNMDALGIEGWAGAGVKDEAGVDEMIAKGATLVTCNNPDVILDLLRQKGKHK